MPYKKKVLLNYLFRKFETFRSTFSKKRPAKPVFFLGFSLLSFYFFFKPQDKITQYIHIIDKCVVW